MAAFVVTEDGTIVNLDLCITINVEPLAVKTEKATHALVARHQRDVVICKGLEEYCQGVAQTLAKKITIVDWTK